MFDIPVLKGSLVLIAKMANADVLLNAVLIFILQSVTESSHIARFQLKEHGKILESLFT